MKKLIILSAIAMSGLIYNTANAQIGIRFGFHFGARRVVYAHTPVVVEQAPVYEQSAPVYNDSNDDYYYLPDIDAYYYVPQRQFVYLQGRHWVFGSSRNCNTRGSGIFYRHTDSYGDRARAGYVDPCREFFPHNISDFCF